MRINKGTIRNVDYAGIYQTAELIHQLIERDVYSNVFDIPFQQDTNKMMLTFGYPPHAKQFHFDVASLSVFKFGFQPDGQLKTMENPSIKTFKEKAFRFEEFVTYFYQFVSEIKTIEKHLRTLSLRGLNKYQREISLYSSKILVVLDGANLNIKIHDLLFANINVKTGYWSFDKSEIVTKNPEHYFSTRDTSMLLRSLKDISSDLSFMLLDDKDLEFEKLLLDAGYNVSFKEEGKIHINIEGFAEATALLTESGKYAVSVQYGNRHSNPKLMTQEEILEQLNTIKLFVIKDQENKKVEKELFPEFRKGIIF